MHVREVRHGQVGAAPEMRLEGVLAPRNRFKGAMQLLMNRYG